MAAKPAEFYELRLIAMIFAWNGAFWSLNLTAINAAPLTAFRILSSPEGLFAGLT